MRPSTMRTTAPTLSGAIRNKAPHQPHSATCARPSANSGALGDSGVVDSEELALLAESPVSVHITLAAASSTKGNGHALASLESSATSFADIPTHAHLPTPLATRTPPIAPLALQTSSQRRRPFAVSVASMGVLMVLAVLTCVTAWRARNDAITRQQQHTVFGREGADRDRHGDDDFIVGQSSPRKSTIIPLATLPRTPPISSRPPPHHHHPVQKSANPGIVVTNPTRRNAVATQCGNDTASPIRGLIDSFIAVTFDVSKDEMQPDETLQQAASRIVTSAMSQSTDSHSSSSYFTFFSQRRASLKVSDHSNLDDEIASASSAAEGPPAATTTMSQSCATAPLLLDVLYTYVNPNADSHRGSLAQHCDKRRTAECLESRFRDWDELRYSMRTVFERGGMGGDGSGLVRNIHIVVAHEDQVPPWLNRSHPAIRVHTHRDIFPPSEHADALPTFNSNAIEAALHRTPGLSRFFVYFNNDMFWGRPLSLFDYFRPLSRARQEHRRRTSKDARCLLDFAEQQQQQERSHDDAGTLGARSSETVKPGVLRATVLFEPILYFERLDEYSDRKLLRKSSAVLKKLDFRTNKSLCDSLGIDVRSVFTLHMKTPRGYDSFHKFVNHNRQLLFDHYGLAPSHSFAHYPRLIDRSLFHEMLAGEFAEDAQDVRRRRTRSEHDMWTPYLYQYVALAHRRETDGALLASLGLWKRPVAVHDSSSVSDISPFYDADNGQLPVPLRGESETKMTLLLHSENSRLAQEKTQWHIVSLDGTTEPVYGFYMLRSLNDVHSTLNELRRSMRLFLTLNDDLYYSSKAVVDSFTSLLEHIGGRTPVEWEVAVPPQLDLRDVPLLPGAAESESSPTDVERRYPPSAEEILRRIRAERSRRDANRYVASFQPASSGRYGSRIRNRNPRAW